MCNQLDPDQAPTRNFFYKCIYINRMADSITTGMLCQKPYLPPDCNLGTANCLLFILAIGWGLNTYQSAKMWCDMARARGNGLSQTQMLYQFQKGDGLQLDGAHGIYIEAIHDYFFFHGPSLVASFDNTDLVRIRQLISVGKHPTPLQKILARYPFSKLIVTYKTANLTIPRQNKESKVQLEREDQDGVYAHAIIVYQDGENLMQACAMRPVFEIIDQDIYNALEMNVYVIELKGFTEDPDETVNGTFSFRKWTTVCEMMGTDWVKSRLQGRNGIPWPYQGKVKKNMELLNAKKR